MDVVVGLRVVRGPHWRWGEQDGGDGHVGTVVCVHHLQHTEGHSTSPLSCAVTVQWDCGNRCRYRCGIGDKYDLRVLDSAPAGIKHNRIVCNNCNQYLSGTRWKCVRCYDFDLCTLCYMSGEHNLDHEFDRMDTSILKARIPTRVSSKKKDARGIFPRSLVEPGRDWVIPKNKGPVSAFLQGEVTNVLGRDGDNSRSHVEVLWTDSEVTTIHCVGHNGKVELKCVESSSISYYYPDHLPDLGAPLDEVEVDPSPVEGVTVGDFVRAELDPEVFKAMLEESVGWSDQMMEILGVVGRVSNVLPSGNLQVQYNNWSIWTLCAGAVVKVDIPPFKVGDLVLVDKDFTKVSKFQKSRGHGHDGCSCSTSFMGQVCRVLRILPSGDIYLTNKATSWIYNPHLLVPYNELTSLPWPNPLLPSRTGEGTEGSLDRIRGYLEINASQVNKRRVGRTALHCAAAMGDIAMIKLLLEFQANVDIADEKGYSPLHYSIMGSHTGAVLVLIDAGVDVNVAGPDGVTPLMLAATAGHIALLKMLVAHPKININAQDSDGNTALHIATLCQKHQSITILLDAGGDPSMINFSLSNCVMVATTLGYTSVVEQLLAKNPELLNSGSAEYKSTPLHIAAVFNYVEVTRALLSKREVVVDSRNDLKQTPLHCAILRGNTTIVEMLVSHGASVTSCDIDGMVPLHMMLYMRDTMQSPTELSPEILTIQKVLMGPLLDNHSCVYGPINVSAYLLRMGADIHQKNKKGQSPLEFCPYLATLMTVLVENEDLFTGKASTQNIPRGLLNLYGGRPILHRKLYRYDEGHEEEQDYSSDYSRGGTHQGKFSGIVGYSDTAKGHDTDHRGEQNPYLAYYAYRDGGSPSYDGERAHGYGGTNTTNSSYASGGIMSHGPRGGGGAGVMGGSYYYDTDGSSSGGGYQNGHHSYQRSSRPHPPPKPARTESKPQPDVLAGTGECYVCEGRADVRFKPCGHSTMCSQCASRAKRCPTCRSTITSYSRL